MVVEVVVVVVVVVAFYSYSFVERLKVKNKLSRILIFTKSGSDSFVFVKFHISQIFTSLVSC